MSLKMLFDYVLVKAEEAKTETASGLKRRLLVFIEKLTARLSHRVVCVSKSVLITLTLSIKKEDCIYLQNQGLHVKR